jgi:hypothetical protein
MSDVPRDAMRVDRHHSPTHRPGELRFGESQVIATSFSGQMSATIPELNPMEHADESFLELVTADAFLKADVQTLAHVGAYTPETRIEAGAGPFEARILISNGRISAPTYATFSTKKVGVRRTGFALHVSRGERRFGSFAKSKWRWTP